MVLITDRQQTDNQLIQDRYQTMDQKTLKVAEALLQALQAEVQKVLIQDLIVHQVAHLVIVHTTEALQEQEVVAHIVHQVPEVAPQEPEAVAQVVHQVPEAVLQKVVLQVDDN